jgi:uncharacterized protein (TIGR03435 family)
MRICVAMVAALALWSGASRAQQGPETEASAAPAFEVASIKPRVGEPAFGAPSSPDRFTYPGATLVDLIRWAHELQGFQVEGGPEWIQTDRFDVSAKASSAQPQTVMRRMVARLLRERFNLESHVETREMPVYLLRTARSDARLGEQMRPSSVDCAALIEANAVGSRADSSSPPPCLWRVGITTTIATMMLDGVSMPRFASLLQPMLQRVVVDETGLPGTYEIRLEFAADQLNLSVPLPADAPAPPSRDGLSLFTALQDQLGLKVEPARGPVDILIVDSVDRPTPD